MYRFWTRKEIQNSQVGFTAIGWHQFDVATNPVSAILVFVNTPGYSLLVVSDNGIELTANAMPNWQQDRRVEWHYIASDKPMQNGFVESFDSRLRTECLITH